MPDFPLLRGGNRYETAGISTASSIGTIVASHATADTKGSWTEIIASTAFDGQAVDLHVRPGASYSYLFDIGIGAASSEIVVIPDFLVTNRLVHILPITFPISIPAGTRISARVQDSNGGNNIRLGIYLWAQTFLNSPGLGPRVTAYGASTADSGGTSIDPGGTANTKGSWAELSASTGNLIASLFMSIGHQENTTRAGAGMLYDIGIGAASSEIVVISNIWVRQDNNVDDFVPSFLGPYPVNIPSGTRLAVRDQSTITDAADRLSDVAIYGVG